MWVTKTILLSGAMAISPYLMAEQAPSVPEACFKLAASLESCDKGPAGPFGTVRKYCRESAKMKYKCPLPVDEVMSLLKK